MTTQLNALIIEDEKNDLFLLLNHLRQYWTTVNYEVVDSLEGVTEALNKKWDVIICDFYLPSFDGLTVLRIVTELGIKTPFILVSGQVPEDIAAAMMRLGASDYVMKENLKRLAPAILRELTPATMAAGNSGPVAKSDGVAESPKVGVATPEAETGDLKELNKLLTLWYPRDPSSADIKILERHRAIVNIMYVANLIKNYQHRILDQYNLSEQQLTILRFLKRVYPVASNMNLIKENSINKTSDTSRTVQRMAAEGLVIYHVSDDDKRVRDILISEKGLQAINEVDKVSDQMFLPETYLSEDDAKKINEGLAKTLRIMSDEKAIA
jgi:CheY-like chemotaxis protein/DNA-binding MarR family transcriptional regulator